MLTFFSNKMNFFKNDLTNTELKALVLRLEKLDIFLNEYYTTHYNGVENYIYNTYLGYPVDSNCIYYNEGATLEETQKYRKLQGTLKRAINIEVANNFSFFMGKNKWVYVNINCNIDESPYLCEETKFTDDFKIQLMNTENLIFFFCYNNVVTHLNKFKRYNCLEYLLCLDECVIVEDIILEINKYLLSYKDKYNCKDNPRVFELKTSNELSNFFKGEYWFSGYSEDCVYYTYPHFTFSFYKFNYSVLEYYLLISHIINIGMVDSSSCLREDSYVIRGYMCLYCTKLGFDIYKDGKYNPETQWEELLNCIEVELNKDSSPLNYIKKIWNDKFLDNAVFFPSEYICYYKEYGYDFLVLENFNKLFGNPDNYENAYEVAKKIAFMMGFTLFDRMNYDKFYMKYLIKQKVDCTEYLNEYKARKEYPDECKARQEYREKLLKDNEQLLKEYGFHF